MSRLYTMQLQQAIQYLEKVGAKVTEATITPNAVYHGVLYKHRVYYVYQETGSTMAVIGVPSINTERPLSVTADIDSTIGR